MTQEKKRLGLTVPTALYEKLAEKAGIQGKTINSTCVDIFWNYFEARQNASAVKKRVPRITST